MRRRYGWSWYATLTLGMTAVLAAASGGAATAPPDPAVRAAPVDPAPDSGEVAVSVRVQPGAQPPPDDQLPVTGTGAAPELLVLLGAVVLLLGVLLVIGARRAARRRAG